MFIKKKFDYNSSREGKFWAAEANAIVDELLNVIRTVANPLQTKVDQLLYSISMIGTFNMWRTSDTFNLYGDRYYTIHRKSILPHPQEYVVGMSGDLRFNNRTEEENPKMSFFGLDPLNIRRLGVPIIGSNISKGNLYKWELVEDPDTQEIYFDIIPMLGEQLIVTDGKSSVITSPPKEIVNNCFYVDKDIVSDIFMGSAYIYNMFNGELSSDFDVKRCQVDPNNSKKVIIHDDSDNIDLNGQYAVITYGG